MNEASDCKLLLKEKKLILRLLLHLSLSNSGYFSHTNIYM